MICHAKVGKGGIKAPGPKNIRMAFHWRDQSGPVLHAYGVFACLVIFSCFLSSRSTFWIKMRNTIRVSINLDPDQAPTFCRASSGPKLFAKDIKE